MFGRSGVEESEFVVYLVFAGDFSSRVGGVGSLLLSTVSREEAEWEFNISRHERDWSELVGVKLVGGEAVHEVIYRGGGEA